ncbi:UrvD/REP family ATP-dependent DNA helicase [Homoserinibacter sp. YIM 151385]|uniref:UrvD/REP family ATP-dependent DNA helicase n=1 Tax=Homoserinibacter sp. YIM 151385 TaxID=2985506 RepID=UPI0022F0D498|nr:UrvD/REP family ATP-dependent DNA helicase [Homoserinibacter sp. YIM 151385]WBU38151.1 PD-(D/E)XK nuclease family protein [Homoserinibacter sp. YIM 151385]
MDLDLSQRAVLELPAGASAVVLGAPGSGKTAVLEALAAERVASGDLAADEILAIASSRRAAAAMRERLAIRLGQVTTGDLARTASSVAFEAVASSALLAEAPAPRLLSGAEQDLVIRELLDGQAEGAPGPDWPAHLDPGVRALPVFRGELRELIARLTELGIGTGELRRLGERESRPEWRAAAEFVDRYRDIIAAPELHEGALDPAELLAFAVRAVEEGEAGERLSRVRLLLVDDLQEATEGALALVAAFARRGAAVVGFGDPDIASNSFRGGEADAVAQTVERLEAIERVGPVRRLVLDRVHRHGPGLRRAVVEITGRIGAARAGTQRRAESALADGAVPPVRIHEAESPAVLHAGIARALRERHLLEGVPWSALAVVVRSGAAVAPVLRALASAQVPCRTLSGGVAVRDEPAAAALLRLVSVGIGRDPLDGAAARELLTGPFGGLDRVGLRRLARELRAESLAGGVDRVVDELLVEALADPAHLASIDHRVGRDARRLAGILAALRAADAAGGTAEELLWAAWDGSGVAEPWRARALGAGLEAEEANRALDGVVALFAAARRRAERAPGEPAGEFLAAVLDAQVPEDTLAPASVGEAVLVTTPAGVVGAEFDTVVLTGLQEGRWPNLRPRGSLLGGQRLLEIVGGVPESGDPRRAVLADELRLLALAVSRARTGVVLAALAGEDEQPSVFHRLLAEPSIAGAEPLAPSPAPLTLRGMTGWLRRRLAAAARHGRSDGEAAAALAALAAAGVPGADPAEWSGLREPSTTAPLHDLADPEARVRVSPSRLEEFQRSPMEWFVATVAGSSGLAAGKGTLLHAVLEEAEDADVESLWSALLERWPQLRWESAWEGERELRDARHAIEAIAAYLRGRAAAGVELLSAEGGFELDLPPAVLAGTIDRVESEAGAVVIVDLKTGRAVTSAKDALDHPQLSAYQVAYADGAIPDLPEGHRPGGAALLFSRRTAKQGEPYTLRLQPPLDPDRLEDFREQVREAARGMAGPGFPIPGTSDPRGRAGAEARSVHLPEEITNG